MKSSFFTSALCFLALVKLGDSIRCYQCRSDELPDCGDPFLSARIPSQECDQYATQSSFLCYKAATYVGGGYVTVRGCAPFNTDFFPRAMQQGMAGTYWNGLNNLISMCDVNNCNSARSLQSIGMFSIIITVVFQFLMSWADYLSMEVKKKLLQIKLPVLKHSSLQIYFHANHKKLSLEIYHFGKITNYPLLTKNFNKRAFQDILNSFCLKIKFQEIRENLPMMHLYKCPFFH